jgi:predicted nucleotidyltransferase
MSETVMTPVLRACEDVAGTMPGLDMLMLFGSRARGDSSDQSDWDFGFFGHAEMDVAALLAAIVTAVGTERVDLVDLDRASGLLRYRAARDGRIVFEAAPGATDRFRLQAADFWCDVGPALQRDYDRLLADLPA